MKNVAKAFEISEDPYLAYLISKIYKRGVGGKV
eukprot:CAMPEP_0168622056 /NCGR_PEP_ID=MMETSP0449_2-20121227/8046_1 /TAXON_ID=1082188 /ORGANISM="Strombidium rassoulzadegani, Strain ras09" /LENGTH=32 /DNA_ID= /DNA_START= /DNA_END= /DNA_ORIENTATION=